MNVKHIIITLLFAYPLILKCEEPVQGSHEQQNIEKKSILTPELCQQLDMQTERNLQCQRKLRLLVRPLVEEFTIENYEKIQALQVGEQTFTAEENRIMQELVDGFCAKNLETITVFAMGTYGISPQSDEAEGFSYVFKKSFPIGFKEEFVNTLEIQRKVSKMLKDKTADIKE